MLGCVSPEVSSRDDPGATLSIVVVTWNNEREIGALLDSIDRHLGARCDVVVVDNASTDGTCAIVDAWRGNATLIRNRHNVGFGAANNAGVAAARARAVVLLNPDTLLVDDSLVALAQTAVTARALCGPELLNEDGTRQPSAAAAPGGWEDALRVLVPGALMPAWLAERCEPWRSRRAVEVGWLTGACIAGARDLLARLGPFDERIHLYAEDTELGLRAKAAGVPSLFLPETARVVHLGDRSSAQLSSDAGVDASARNRRWVVEQHRGRLGAARDYAFQLAYHGIRYGAKRLLRRHGSDNLAWLRATVAASRPDRAGRRQPGSGVRNGPLRTVAAFHVGDPSGPSRTLSSVLEELACRGSVVIVLPELGAAAVELGELGRIEITGHRPLLLPHRPTEIVTLLRAFRRDTARFRAVLRHERADLAMIATTSLPALVLAAWLEGVPSIVYAAELYRQGRRGDLGRALAGRMLVALNAQLASAVVASSRRVADQLLAPGSAIVANPPIDPPSPAGASDLLARHGIAGPGPFVATLGNITRGRGQDVAVRAVELARKDFPDLQLIIAGAAHRRTPDRRFEAELRQLVRDRGLEDVVHLVGFAQPREVFAACDVMVNPARVAEGFGRAPLEALAAGRPVVASRVGAIPDVLEDGLHGLLVPPDDPAELAAAICRLLRDPELAARLTAAGRDYVCAAFTRERQVKAFEQALATALDGRAVAVGARSS